MSWFDSVSSRAREKFTEAEEEAHKAVSKVEKEAGAAISKVKEAATSVVHLAEAPEPSQATLDQMASDAADFAKNAMENAKRAARVAKEEFAPIVDAGMQFNSGVDEAKFDTIKGIVVGAGDRIVKTYGELKAHPELLMAGPTNGIPTASAVVDLKEVRARAAAQGDSAWGWFDAVNRQWNPGVGVAEHGWNAANAIADKDWHKAGAEVTHTGVAVANTVSLVEGVAGLAKGVGMPKGANPVRVGASMAEGAEGVAGSRPSLAEGISLAGDEPIVAEGAKGAGLAEGAEGVAARRAVHEQEVLAQIRDVNKVNEGVPLRSQKNCLSCAIAADKTLGGNPTFAENVGPVLLQDALQDIMAQYPNWEPGIGTHVEIETIMREAGPGSRGIVVITHPSRSVSHAINVVNHEGTVVFADAQSGQLGNVPQRRIHILMRTNKPLTPR